VNRSTRTIRSGVLGMSDADTLGAAMRTWVVGLLLAVMSFQSVWASVATYCRHQADVVTDHIGHHEHQHDAVAPDADETPTNDATTPDANLGSVDNDCGYCHFSCAQPLATKMVEPWLGQAGHSLISPALTRYSSREPGGVERPKWLRLAASASLEESRIT